MQLHFFRKTRMKKSVQLLALSALLLGSSLFYKEGSVLSADVRGPFAITAYAAGGNYVKVGDSLYAGPGASGGTVTPLTTNEGMEAAFSSGELRVLRDETGANTTGITESQQLSMVMRSSDGKVIVVDGGVSRDSTHLLSTIQSLGGYVDAWLITHPQADHVGALIDILQNHAGEIDIRNIYYHFFDYTWYEAVDPGESGVVWVLKEELAKLPADCVHGEMKRGDVVTLSENLSFRVLNDAMQSEGGSYAVNDSGLMYDVNLNGKHVIVLGDMGPEMGDRLLADGVLDGITADYVQVSHHGQHGVTEAFYRALSPKACIWPTPSWLYNAQPNNPQGFTTYLTRSWMDDLNVTENYGTRDGDVLIR